MADKSVDASPSKVDYSPKQEERPSGNWWDSWISSAKTKSAEVYSMVKKDLDEIGSAVKNEASHVFSTTSNVIGKTLKLDEPESPANVMKKSLSSFIGQVSTVLNPEPDDEDDTEVILSSGDTTMLSTYKKELEGLQRVDATFIVPAYSPEFEAWRASFESSESVITPSSAIRRLETSPVLKAQYEKLVPDAVSHDEFWERYLFRVALLQDRLAAAARRGAGATGGAPDVAQGAARDPVLAHLPVQHQPQSPKKTPEVDSDTPDNSADIDNVAWEDEDFANDLELTEEQQILLLEEYEKEIASKKLTKQNSSRDITNNNTKNKSNNSNTQSVKSAQTTDKNKQTIDTNKNVRSPKKIVKSDLCGNNLVEDYFGDKEQVKDDASANSDESWEKEFEIEDVVDKKC